MVARAVSRGDNWPSGRLANIGPACAIGTDATRWTSTCKVLPFPVSHVRCPCRSSRNVNGPTPARSEEHTSELQSLTNLVCRLLLEKKKKKKWFTRDYKKMIVHNEVTQARKASDIQYRLNTADK